MRLLLLDNTAPNVFANGPAAINSFDYTFPGQTGAWNQIRGPESAAATNPAGTLYNGNGQTFGNYTGLITNPRIMQFALRYEF